MRFSALSAGSPDMVESRPPKTAALDLVFGSIEMSRAAFFSFSEAKNSSVMSPLQLEVVCVSV